MLQPVFTVPIFAVHGLLDGARGKGLATPEWLEGVLGRAVQGSVVGGSAATWSRVDDADGAIWVRLPDAGPELARALILQRVATDEASAAQSPAGRTGTPTVPSPAWLAAEILSGVAAVQPATIEAFVPQMLNYESVGGVSFKKGCYPGQEVVARSQFRGTLKRRACLVHCEEPMAAGDEVFQASDADQPCGTVVQVAATPQGGCEAIVSAQVTAIEAAQLRHGSVDGAALSILTLPYPLLSDI